MPTFDEVIRIIAELEMPDSEHHLIETFQDSAYFWANTNLSLMRKWIIETDMMLDKTLEKTDVRAFYINLHGIVEDMHSHHEKRIETLKGVFQVDDVDLLPAKIDELKGDMGMRNYLKLSVAMFKDLENIRNDYDDFELKQIMYFRHRWSHPLLTKLSVKINKKKKFTGVEIDALMRKIAETDELDAMKVFHGKLLSRHKMIKGLNDILRAMQFS